MTKYTNGPRHPGYCQRHPETYQRQQVLQRILYLEFLKVQRTCVLAQIGGFVQILCSKIA